MCYDIHEYEDLMEEMKQLGKIKKAERPVEALVEVKS